ncbi:uracil-DNA glycosylase [Pandoraea capi]|uniref:uracil-DNA glycosylase n=1 Tax=Pandoraea TaxID=93217 RepID=UPI001F5C85A9|nr:uracil-DNA glycosylase [Pandoraea capi]MCI3208480.1 uracil-DNA glycosylase [Pandoraea sp. LA3]MDN4586509.1 uracil-DNA glycosylase [Pandoraea capi]
MPWPKAILEEFGLWPVWMSNDAVANAAASAVTADEGDVATLEASPMQVAEISPTVVPGEEPPPWDMPSAVPSAGMARPAMRAPALGDAPAAPVRREVAPAPVARESNRRAADIPPDDVPMWLDSDGFGDGDAAADAALWSIVRDGGEDTPSRPKLPGVETLDWDALTERVSNCRLCGLCEKRTQTVFGVGDREADWLLVGEAPGQQEDLQGEPFVGQAGKLLDNMLRASALQRGENVYIANVLKCRPPNNRDPEPDEVASCEPYLKRQVALLKPRVIVVMGRFAAQSILRTQASIASLRGRVHEYEGVPVIVTYHPAYLLRSLPDKAKAWTDWCLARATYEAVCETTPDDKPTAN